MLMTSVASVQLALLKTRATHGRSGVVISDRSATARTKNAIGTTTRFASKEIGVTRWNTKESAATNQSTPQATQMRHRKAIRSWNASIGVDRAPGFAAEKDPEPHAAGKI